MKNKNNLFIGAFFLLFLLLLGIHTYYFYNSYLLKEKDIVNTVHSQLSDLEEVAPYFVESNNMDDEILLLFSKFQTKQIDYKTVEKYFHDQEQKASPQITKYIDSLFQKEGYRVALRKELKNLVALPSKDTLIKNPLILYQTDTPVQKYRTVTEGRWTTSSSNSDSDLNNYDLHKRTENPIFYFQITRSTYYDIVNLPLIVLRQLIPLMFSSILILIAVLLLYFLTYKNLVKHRQESLILHDIVDNISHEFKTPIATLKIATKTLYKNSSLEILPLIDRQIDRLENLVYPIHIQEELDRPIDRLIESDLVLLLEDFSFSHPEITFEKQVEIKHPLHLYKIEMQTLLNNLIGNSIKFGASTVGILIKTTPTVLIVEISDNGIGIDNRELKHLTKKYYRVQKNNIQNTKGLGLGLYLVHKIILKYRGAIQINSILTTGTTVKITLPYVY